MYITDVGVFVLTMHAETEDERDDTKDNFCEKLECIFISLRTT